MEGPLNELRGYLTNCRPLSRGQNSAPSGDAGLHAPTEGIGNREWPRGTTSQTRCRIVIQHEKGAETAKKGQHGYPRQSRAPGA